MATLVFRVSAQYDEVIKLRNEISKLEAQLKKMDVNKSPAAAKALETQLASARQQMMGLVTEAAKAGAVMEKDFKSNIYNASQSVNDFTQKIIDQKRVVKDVEHDVKRLGDSYKTALKRNPTGAASLLSEYQSAKKTLDEEKATLFGLTQQQAEARLSVKKLKDEYAAFKEEAGETVEANDKMSVSLTKVLGVIGGVTALKNFVTELVNVRGQFQQLEIAFSTMLKSKEKADKLMSELVDIAAKTSFDLQGVASSAKQMIAYGSSAENVGDELVMLGNVAAGVGSQLSEIAYLYGTLRTQGRAYATDIRQFAGRGIPIYEELAKVLGVTKDEVSSLVTAGKVGFKEVEQAFKNMTSESGIYYNLMQEQSKSLTGQLSNLGDAWDTMLNEIGKDTQGIASSGISAVKGLIENYETVGKVLLGLIATYGTYKTALIVTRITQDALTARMELAILVTKAQTVAQKALNLTMSVNPYAAIATVVVVTSAALLNYASNLDKCKKGIDAYNKSVEEAARKEAEHKEEIEKLLSVAQDEQSSTEDRKEALIRLEQKYPDIFKKYKTEADMLRDILNIKKQINEEDERRRNVSDQEELNRLNAEINKLNEAIKSASQSGAGLSIQSLVNEKNNLIKQRDLKQEEVNKKRHDEILSDLSGYSNEQLQKEVDVRERLIKRLENAQKLGNSVKNGKILNGILPGVKTNELLQAEKQAIERELNNRGKTNDEIKNKKYWEDKKKEAEAARDALDVSEKNTEKWNKYTQQIQEAQSQVEKYANPSTAKKDSEQQKKEQEQLAEELLQLRFKNQQEEINLMEEGSEKKRRQIELDYQKEIEAYNKAKAKYGDTDEVKAMKSNADNRHSAGLAAINEEEQKKEQERIKAQEEAWNEALIKFGNYNQRRKAIIEKYDKEIVQAQNAGDEWAKIEEKKAALEELDEQYGKSTRAMADLFEDAGKKSVTSIQKIIDKYETLVKYLSGTEQSDGTPVTLDELKAIGFTDRDIESIERGEISIRDLTDALKNLNGELEGKSPWMSFVNDMQKSIGKIKSAKGDSEKIGEGVMDIGNAVTDFAPALGEFAENIGSIFGVDDDKIEGIVGSVQGLGQAAVGVGQILSGDVVGGAMSAVGGISKVISSLEGLFGADYSEYEDMKAQYDTLISVWDTLIGKKTEYIDIDYGIEAQKAAEEATKLTETQIKRQRQLANMLAGSGASVGSHSLGYRVNVRMNSQDWQRLSGIVGQDVGSLGDVLALDADVIGNVLQDERFVSVLTEVNSEFIDYISNIGEYAEQLEEIAEKEKEALTGVGLDDFRNGYTDLLADLDSDNQDFADDFEKYLQNAIFSSLVANKYKERIEKLYNQWADYADSGSKLTGDEAEQLRNDYQNIVDDMLAEREQIMKEFGWSSTSSGQQSASSRGFGTEMTHEDAGELSGRFTAVYESNLRIETAEQQQTVAITELRGSIGSLTSQVTGLYNIADETRTILANSYLELQQIRENTEDSVKYLKDIKADISEVKRNTSRL